MAQGDRARAQREAREKEAQTALTPEMVDAELARSLASQQEEAQLRQQQSERPEGDSVMDLTINTLGYPVDLYQTYIGNPFNRLVGAKEQPLLTDVAKDKMRNTEAGFKIEQGFRQGARDIAMTPAIPSMVWGLTGAALESAVDDEDFAKSMLNDEGQALWDEWEAGDEAKGAQLFNNMGDYQRSGVKFMSEWFEQMGDTMGVADRDFSETPVEEEVIGILTSSFVGLPAGMVRSFGRHMVAELGEGAIERAQKMASTKTARAVTRVSELATPMTLPLTPGNVAANAAVGIGINDVMRYATGADTALGKAIDAGADLPAALAAEPDIPGDPDVQTTPPQIGDVPVNLMGMDLSGLGQAAAENPGGTILTGAGLAAAAVTGMAVLRRPDRMRRILTGDEPASPPPTGELAPNLARQAETELVDSEAPIVHLFDDMVEAAGTTAQAVEKREETLDYLRTMTRQGGEVRADMAVFEGVKPLTPGKRYKNSYQEIRGAFDGELSQDARKILTEGMMADDIRWSIDNGRGNPSRWTPAQLKEKSDLLEQNPQLHKYRDAYRTHTQEVLEQVHKSGRITKDQYKEMKSRPYVPNIRADQPEHGGRLSGLLGSNRDFENQYVDPFQKFRKGDVMDFMDPVDALELYERSATRGMLENAARVQVIKQFNSLRKQIGSDKLKEMFPNGSPIVKRTKKSDAVNEGRLIEVWQNGKREQWEVGDPHLHNALQLTPHSALHVLSDMRRLTQIGTTGELNPAFSVTTAPFIDGFFSSLMRKRHQVGGTLDRITGSHALRQSDNLAARALGEVGGAATALPDVLGNIAAGIVRGTYDEGVRAMAKSLNDGYLKAGLGKLMPESMVKGMSLKAANMMHKTMSYQMKSNGFAPGRFSEQLGDMNASAFDRAYQGLFNNPGLKQYRGVLENVRNSYRLSFYSQQYHKYIRQGLSEEKASVRAAREAREIGSDPSRAGQSKLINQATSTIPYANVGVQAIGTFSRAMTDPRRASIALQMVSHGAYMTAALGGLATVGGLEWWYNEVPDRERARGLPLINPAVLADPDYVFNPDDVIMIDIGPEAAVLRAGMMAGMEYMSGMSSPQQAADPRIQAHMAELGEAAKTIAPWGVPTAANTVLAVTGFGPIQPNRFSANRGLFAEDISGTGMQGGEREFNANGGVMSDYVADVLTATLGGAGKSLSDGVEQFEGHKHQKDSTFLEAMDSVFDRKMFDMQNEFAPMLFGGSRSPTRSNPTIQKAYELRRMMDPVLDQVEINQYGAKRSIITQGNLSEGIHVMSNQVTSSLLQEMLTIVAANFEDNALIDQSYKTMANASDKWKMIEANRALPRKTQAFLQDTEVERMHEASTTLLTEWESVEAGMREAYADFGFTTMEDLFRAAEQDLQRQAR